MLVPRLEDGPVHAPRNIIADLEDCGSFTGIVPIDLVGSVEICDSDQHGGIIIPLALGRHGRRPVPAARRARVNTGVRADGLARDRGHALSSRNLLDHGFVVLLHVERDVVLAVVDAKW